jgi:NhaA family Na+:H+ antiporter
VWANIDAESYFRTSHALAFPVNEIGMALFLGLMTQLAIEAVVPGGLLHSWRLWGVPLVAAAGALAGSAFTYLGYVSWKHEQVLVQAWPIAAAIDIAAGYYLLKMIFRAHGAVAFFLILSFAVDAVGVVVLALWPAFTPEHLGGAILLAFAVSLAAVLRRAHVRAFWPYLALCGSLSWLAFSRAGVHPALALVPIVPFLPHKARNDDLLADPPSDGSIHRAEHEWHLAVHVVLFFFGLVNAGVVVRGYDTGTWAVVSAALIGRPLGILGAVAVALAVGFHLPRRMGWRELTVVALATSSGFTFALFAAASAIPVGAVLTQTKLGALCTAIGAVLAYAAARLLRVGKFSPRGA